MKKLAFTNSNNSSPSSPSNTPVSQSVSQSVFSTCLLFSCNKLLIYILWLATQFLHFVWHFFHLLLYWHHGDPVSLQKLNTVNSNYLYSSYIYPSNGPEICCSLNFSSYRFLATSLKLIWINFFFVICGTLLQCWQTSHLSLHISSSKITFLARVSIPSAIVWMDVEIFIQCSFYHSCQITLFNHK